MHRWTRIILVGVVLVGTAFAVDGWGSSQTIILTPPPSLGVVPLGEHPIVPMGPTIVESLPGGGVSIWTPGQGPTWVTPLGPDTWVVTPPQPPVRWGR